MRARLACVRDEWVWIPDRSEDPGGGIEPMPPTIPRNTERCCSRATAAEAAADEAAAADDSESCKSKH